MSADPAVALLLSAQRALTGNVPRTLRAASAALDGTHIRFRAIFDSGATERDREMLSIAATEIMADFDSTFLLSEEFIDRPAPAKMAHLQHLLFLRDESAA